MIRIMFWNVNKRDLTPFVCALASSTSSDVVVLNENKIDKNDTLHALQQNVSELFYIPSATASSEERFHCFCRHHVYDLTEVHAGFRTSVRNLQIGSQQILLALVHGPDPRNYDTETRQSYAQSIADDMRFVKAEKQNNKLVILGDFNLNPYDRAMNLASGFNAMMTRSCVAAGTRRHMNVDFDFYYNPMWSLFGDKTDGPPGTVYDTSSQGPYGWSMFDQVVINHSIADMFHDVKILTGAAGLTLMDGKGRPDSNKVSDHFPILVTLRG